MLRIGLTGGIACGKSTVAHLFEALHITVIDADAIAREMLSPQAPAFETICDHFGHDILTADGQIHRDKLRRIIFKDPKERDWLEQLLHPAIRTELQSRIAQAASPYCLLVIPLLLEKNLHDDVERILVVDAPESLQIERLKARDNLSLGEIDAILKTQLSREQRLAQADDKIKNDGEPHQLEEQVLKLHEKYLKLSSYSR